MDADSSADTVDRSDRTTTPGSGPIADASDATHADRADSVEQLVSEGWLDRGNGSGARSRTGDWVAEHHAPEANDGRSLTRTTFYASDTDTIGPGQLHRDPEDRRSWSELAGWNDGMYSDVSRGGQNWQADKDRWLDTFAGQLDCTSTQRDYAEHLLEELDIEPFQGAHVPIEHVILGALSLAIDRDVEDFELRASNRESFQQLLAAVEADKGDLRDVREKIRAQR